MKGTGALLVKEWKQVRWYLLSGLAIFVGLPLITMWSYYLKRHLITTADAAEVLVMMFGGLFAIFTAAGLVCPELKDGLAGFWRSRPVPVWKWVLVKYTMGLLTMLIVCTLPLILELFLRRFQPDNYWLGDTVWTVLTCHTFILIFVYSAAFLVSILVRRPTHAILLSAALGLMIYFLPLLIPALERVSILNWITHGKSPKLMLAEDGKNLIEYIQQPVGFGGEPMRVGSGMIGAGRVHWGFWFGSPHWLWLRLPGSRTLVFVYYPGYWFLVGAFLSASALMVIISVFSLHFDWHIKMNQKFLVWSLGLVALLLFASAAFAIGSNLTEEKQIEFSELNFCRPYMTFQEDTGILTCWNNKTEKTGGMTLFRSDAENDLVYETFVFDEPALYKEGLWASSIAWASDRPENLWLLVTHYEQRSREEHYRSLLLWTLYLNPQTKKAELINEQILAEHTSDKNSHPGGDEIVLKENRLYAYVFGQLKILDVSDPRKPEIIKTVEKWSPIYGESGGERMLRLIPDDTVSDEEKLQIILRIADLGDRMASDDQLYASVYRDFIRVYRFDRIQDNMAYLKSIGQRNPTPLERLLDNFPEYSCFKDGFLYVLYQGGAGSGMTVYEISDQGEIRRAGHFALPQGRLQAVTTFSDGRILLIGNKNIYILRPPQRKLTQPNQPL